jgi:hypothetical protein
MREIQTIDFGDRTITAILEQFHYLSAKNVITAQKAPDIFRNFMLDV